MAERLSMAVLDAEMAFSEAYRLTPEQLAMGSHLAFAGAIMTASANSQDVIGFFKARRRELDELLDSLEAGPLQRVALHRSETKGEA